MRHPARLPVCRAPSPSSSRCTQLLTSGAQLAPDPRSPRATRRNRSAATRLLWPAAATSAPCQRPPPAATDRARCGLRAQLACDMPPCGRTLTSSTRPSVSIGGRNRSTNDYDPAETRMSAQFLIGGRRNRGAGGGAARVAVLRSTA